MSNRVFNRNWCSAHWLLELWLMFGKYSKNGYEVVYEKKKHFWYPKCRKHFRLNFENEVQPAQPNVSTANAVVDSSSPIQTQLSAVDNNNDIGWYPNSAKAVKDAKKYLFANSNLLCVERLSVLWRSICVASFATWKRISEMSMLPPLLEKFLRTPMGVTRLDGVGGMKQVWRPHVRDWGLSEANVHSSVRETYRLL